MSHHAVTLPIPDYVYDCARRIAEAVLLQQLKDAFAAPLPDLEPEEQRELEVLTLLSDDALRTIAREQLPADRQMRMQTLMDSNSEGTLDDAQWSELATLVTQGQRLSVRKAQAAARLAERGDPEAWAALFSADE